MVRHKILAEGVVWIALNDEPEEMDIEIIDGMVSTLLLADLCGVSASVVATRVIAERQAQMLLEEEANMKC